MNNNQSGKLSQAYRSGEKKPNCLIGIIFFFNLSLKSLLTKKPLLLSSSFLYLGNTRVFLGSDPGDSFVFLPFENLKADGCSYLCN